MYDDSFLEKKLNQRKQQNAFRQLKMPAGKIDFCSNDYLGIIHNNLLHNKIKAGLKTGSAGSRLLAGNYALIEETEKQIALFHKCKAALIFNSGYDANTGVLSSIPQKGDTILYDALCHASIRDGIRLSFAQSFSFGHNDMAELEKKLKTASGNIFIVTESVFSMDGDFCPLQKIIALSKTYNAHVIIDEAHAIGVIGENGEGLCQFENSEQEIFCRVYTFGKACGCHGAVVCGSQQLKDYLINFARSFIYTTALPEHAAAVIQASYNTFPFLKEERAHLQRLIEYFQQAAIKFEKLSSATPVQIVMIPGNEAVKKIAAQLQHEGFDVRAILYPTVPLNKERLRIIIHAFNTIDEIEELINILS
ncbi:aminotransferase class I/II-fold pyridoxal phosphate-dependent enzyme [Parafilimonas terrae]|uniref:8-amino-7-oxononanoate synthase n=1 Tax=Parafilimonas terrae TaxID=1465490 RepID=A0A1I5TUF5_9BACT|nr:pyridoxal phosphate-dependent aminotransferase family protein [Parafilimonas terrae]SFP86702.1 8-amino-7-oxononanoate synthase [Parafilimonas terrae]